MQQNPLQKETIKGFLEGRNGAKKAEGWLLRYMHFPMQGYTKRKGLPAVEQWKSVSKLFEKLRNCLKPLKSPCGQIELFFVNL